MNKLTHQAQPKLIVFAGDQENEYCFLLDISSNMMELFFDYISTFTNRINLGCVCGKFADRQFFKVSIIDCDYRFIENLSHFINNKVEFYESKN